MKKLPTGRQEFSELIDEKCIYVDKTKFIYKLLDQKYYFLSRPRRFGKSLLLNTIKEIFLGNKDLFKGLWIYDKIDWEIFPVIKISFSKIDYKNLGLGKAIDDMVLDIAAENNIQLIKPSYALKFEELIKKLSEKGKVVILIDEYDKPIIDYLDDAEKAKENRDILKNFYSIVKDADKYIRFLFITGVSKFSKVSIFSDLNNLDDITLDENYSNMLGWTQEELEKYFPEYISAVQKKYSKYYTNILPVIKDWYNGYSWDGENFVYNPVSLLNLFSKEVFRNYWFNTGTPTFLTKLIKEERYTPFDIENSYSSSEILDKFEIDDIEIIPLLFQTGYLTIKKIDLFTGRITLNYPNKEVDQSFSTHLLSRLTINKKDKTEILLFQIIDSFQNKKIEKYIEHINTFFKTIPYSIIEEKEKYFHSVFYTIMKIVGFRIDAEILTIDGRIDAVVKTEKEIYILEFKINQSAEKAIRQIIEKGYADKYSDDKRPVLLLGINFDTETKRVDDYLVKELG